MEMKVDEPNQKTVQVCYLYGFSRSGAAASLGLPGVDGRAEVTEVPMGAGVSAVLSTVGSDEFGPLFALDQPVDLDWVVPRACRHERVVEGVMARSPVLPVRFGTIFSSREALGERTAGRRDEIAAFLGRVTDREEWGLKAYLERALAADWLLGHDPELSRRWQQLSATPGARYFQEKSLRQLAQDRARSWGREQAEAIVAAVSDCSESIVRCPATASAAGDALLHLALLLPGPDVAGFLDRVESLAAPLRERGLSVKASGPWPPYHFCPAFERIAEGSPS
ncbi:MAG: GvpL/GvpF family gas vesicle protein [Isosphaeraceae bacterium]|nr:GvpL/GvpF family gas vesicle protein [Isosphaeraceae bacterium]